VDEPKDKPDELKGKPVQEIIAAAQSVLSPDALFAQASPAVVKVVVQDREGQDVRTGSGFLVSRTGLIATNYHVVAKAHAVQVVFADKTKVPVTGATALDEEGDLAIVKLGWWTGQGSVQPLELAGADLPPVGTKVYAIGTPLGRFANTLSDGLISAHRETGTVPLRPRMPAMLQTTAPISHGSSGGPLLTADGKVVGVTTLTFRDFGGENLNLAVPASNIRTLLLRSENESQLTRFPLPGQPVDQLPTSLDEWSKQDLENASHFVRAMQYSDQALKMCPKSASWESQPALLVTDAARREFAYLMEKANREARLVRKDVLKRMHVKLPDAFDDFITATGSIAVSVVAKQPDSRASTAWNHWIQWCRANGPEVRIPRGLRP
jgi:hypothetical protein